MKDESKIIDTRSTGRRKARKALFNAYVPFECAVCRKTNIEPPKDAPPWFDEIWGENRILRNDKNSAFGIQADHLSKDYMYNEIEMLEWKCPSCHKLADSKTKKGVPQKELRFW